MITPTHYEISLQAMQLWRNRGSPPGCDIEIWLEAEQQLNGELTAPSDAALGQVEPPLSEAQQEKNFIRAEMRKGGARLPQVLPCDGPKTKPARGKPR